MKQAIKRDGRVLAVVEPNDVLAWFMRNCNQSMHWHLKYDGYTVEDYDGREQLSSSGD